MQVNEYYGMNTTMEMKRPERRDAFLTPVVGQAILPTNPTRCRHHLVTGEQGESE